VIPLITLGQRSTWHPDSHVPGGKFVLWWLNLATLLGWLLSSIFVLSLARLPEAPDPAHRTAHASLHKYGDGRLRRISGSAADGSSARYVERV
jgi:hypothetical protein